MERVDDLAVAVENGRREEATRLTRELLERGWAPLDIVDHALTQGMTAIGQRFRDGEAFVPEMLIAARAMKECMAILDPLLAAEGVTPAHTAIIGTVLGDLHDIGKNLVAMMWRGAGFRTVDIGTNVAPEKFVEAVKEHRADIVGLSALLTTTMPAMTDTVAAIRAAGLDSVKVLVGGAPVTESFASEIGADGYAPDAARAVDAAMAAIGGET